MENNNKIIFRELDYTDTSILYDNDGIKEISGRNYILYIIAGRDYCPVNEAEYKDMTAAAEELANDITDFMNGYSTYYRNYKHILEDHGIKYSPAAVKRIKAWSLKFNYQAEDYAEYLTITTGEKWNTYTETGYSQGDYATGIYCEGLHTNEALELYVGAAAGTVSEFVKIDGEDQICGFFVPDRIKWNEAELRNYLAEFEGDNAEDIQIDLFDGFYQVAKYKTI